MKRRSAPKALVVLFVIAAFFAVVSAFNFGPIVEGEKRQQPIAGQPSHVDSWTTTLADRLGDIFGMQVVPGNRAAKIVCWCRQFREWQPGDLSRRHGSSRIKLKCNRSFPRRIHAGGSICAIDSNAYHGFGCQQALNGLGHRNQRRYISRSPDGRYIVLAGYDAAVRDRFYNLRQRFFDKPGTGPCRPYNLHGYDETAIADNTNMGNSRGAATTNGTDLWLSTGSVGVRYVPFGGTSSVQVSNTITSIRCIQVFDGQLYISSASGTFRIATVGTGTPTTTGQNDHKFARISNGDHLALWLFLRRS